MISKSFWKYVMLYTGQRWRMSLYHFQENVQCYDWHVPSKKIDFLNLEYMCTSNLKQKGKPFCIYKYELLIQMYVFWESHHLTFYNQNLSLKIWSDFWRDSLTLTYIFEGPFHDIILRFILILFSVCFCVLIAQHDFLLLFFFKLWSSIFP